MDTVQVILERESANDEGALVVMVFVPSGTSVQKNEVLFEIETSKATQEVCAPESGIFMHTLEVGQTVNFGVPLAQIQPTGQGAAESHGFPSDGHVESANEMLSASKASHGNGTRPSAVECEPSGLHIGPVRPVLEPSFSHAAMALMAAYGFEPSQVHTSFVTSADVREMMGRGSRPEPLVVPQSPRGPIASARTEEVVKAGKPVGSRKRAEIDVLGKGAGGGMLSVLGTSLGPILISREPGDFLAGRITDLVIYEASRLMRKYPLLNSFFEDGHVVTHSSVHAGLAVDDGGRLVVYGIEGADAMEFRELSKTIADAVYRYMNNELTGPELSRATFTITDLSADELDFVFPLLPRGQSCILGITHSVQAGFRIFAGFDHRVTEGREVAAFLGELRSRVLSFASAERPDVGANRCVYCERSLKEAVHTTREKGLLKIVGGDGREVLCCGSCWNGW